MSIKNILSIIVLLVVAVTFSACGVSYPKDNPNTDDSVYGNGGMQVRKGDYVYFVNGFFGIDSFKEGSNKYGDVVRGGIYRTKLVNGNIEFDEETNEAKNTRVIVPKIVGYEFGGFYIYDDYIYYATPNNEKDKQGQLTNKLVDIYRCDINGDDNKKIYTTKAEYTEVSFNVIKINTKEKNYSTFVLVKDGDKLLTIEFVNGKNKGTKVIADKEVNSVAWLEQSNYFYGDRNSGIVDEVNKSVYFTKTTDGISILSAYDLVTKQITELANDGYNTYTLKGLKNNALYYEKANNGNTAFVENSLNGSFIADEKVMYNNSYSNYFIMENQSKSGVIASSDNATYFVEFGKNGAEDLITISDNTGYKVLFANGSKVYVRKDSAQVMCIDLNDVNFEAKNILKDGVAGKNDGAKYVDFDGRFMTYYGENKAGDNSTYYTHFVDFETMGEDNLYSDKVVAEYAKGEKPEIEKDEENK